MKKAHCKKCKNKYPSLTVFKFDMTIYKHLEVLDDTKNLIKELNGEFLCQNCFKELQNNIFRDDYQIRGVEHIGVKGACKPHVTILSKQTKNSGVKK